MNGRASSNQEISEDWLQYQLANCFPSQVVKKNAFYCGDVVSAVLFFNSIQYVLTGGKGIVKIWDINQQNPFMPLSKLNCLVSIHELKSMGLPQV